MYQIKKSTVTLLVYFGRTILSDRSQREVARTGQGLESSEEDSRKTLYLSDVGMVISYPL